LASRLDRTARFLPNSWNWPIARMYRDEIPLRLPFRFRQPDRRNLDSALLSSGRGCLRRAPWHWGRKPARRTPFTGGFSRGSTGATADTRPLSGGVNATGTAPPGGNWGTSWAGAVQAALPGADPTKYRRFLRSFLRHFQQPARCPPEALHAPNLGTIRLALPMCETFTIVPAEIPLPGWLTVLRNGAPVWHVPAEKAERYARDPEYRESLRATKAHNRPPT
jgi:hypothetical protein